MTQTSNTDRALISLILVAVPLVYWPYLKDYTLGPKLLVWQLPLIWFSARQILAPRTFPNNPIILAASAYLFLNTISLGWALDPVAGLVELVKLLTGFIFLCAVSSRDPDDHDTFATYLILAVTGSAILGILQHLGVSPWRIPSSGLPSGTLGFRNIAAMVTIQTIPFAVWKTLRSERKSEIGWAICVALLVGFLILTRTRGAWVGLAGASCFGLVLVSTDKGIGKRWRPLALAGILGLGLGFLPSQIEKTGPQSIDEKKTEIADAIGSVMASGGDRGRLVVWGSTLSMLAEYPFVGVGLGNWSIQYPKYDGAQTVSFDASPSRPHNDFLWIASELGAAGLIPFLWMLLAAGRVWRQNGAGNNAGISTAAIASLTAVLIHGCFSFPRDRATPTLLFWFALGILGSLSPGTGASRSKAKWAVTTVCTILLALVSARLLAFEALMHQAARSEREGNWEKVASTSARALESGRFHPEAIHLRGYALNTSGRYADAAMHYKRHQTLRPHDVQFLNGYAIALHNTGSLAEAEHRYLQARDLIVRSADLDYNLATLLIQMKRPEEAVDLLEFVARKEGPSGPLLFHLGNALALSGRTDRAVEVLKQATREYPGIAQSWLVLGELYLRQGKHSEAVTTLEGFLLQHPVDDQYSRRARRVIESLNRKPEEQ